MCFEAVHAIVTVCDCGLGQSSEEHDQANLTNRRYAAAENENGSRFPMGGL
jgi:hypothetical protein